jgi:phosphoribosylanthranilate isomerase
MNQVARVRVKVCGITRIDDALAAAAAGVDAIGLVFYPHSSRRVDIATAAAISAALPAFVTPVGLFLNAPAADVRAVIEQVPLDLLQFHGDEDPAFCRAFGKPFIKAVPMRVEADVSVYARDFDDARALLLDSHGGGVIGGSGKAFDWALVPPEVAKPIVLAGGLQPDNAAAAVRAVRPYGLDVSSGVETARGIKDAALIERFVAAVNGV